MVFSLFLVVGGLLLLLPTVAVSDGTGDGSSWIRILSLPPVGRISIEVKRVELGVGLDNFFQFKSSRS